MPTLDKIKIVFAGTPDFAVPSLQALLADPRCQVLEAWTQPDRPAGRGQLLQAAPVKILAESAGVGVYQPVRIESAAQTRLLALQPDFLVVVAYGLLLPQSILATPRLGCLNVHASLLPKYRGASPIQAALLAGESETGVSFMRLVQRLDAGPVFARLPLPLTGCETAGELTQTLAQLGGQELPNILAQIVNGQLLAKEQVEAEATHCHKITKLAGRVDWQRDTAQRIHNKWRAYTPWPGIWTEWQGQPLKLLSLGARRSTEDSRPLSKQPGEVFIEPDAIYIAAAEQTAIEVQTLQLPGKKPMPITEFVRGHPDFLTSRCQ